MKNIRVCLGYLYSVELRSDAYRLYPPFSVSLPTWIERYTFNLANVLARSGDEIHILTWRWPQPIRIDALETSVQVHLMPTHRYFAAQAVVPFYTWHLLKQRYDFVWVFFPSYGEAATLRLVRHQPFGIVLHYPLDQVPHRYHEFCKWGLAGRARHIVAVSNFVADGVREAFRRESTIISHGVDAQLFAPNPKARSSIRRQLGLSPETLLLVTAAALEERKGIQWVMRAMPHVLQEVPEARYIVLGDGPYRAELDQLAQALGIEHAVRLLGAQSDIVPFYQAADLSVLLARGEASSLTSLESLACCLPVITSTERPFDELIKPEFGLRVPEQDTLQVANTLISLLRDPARRHAMGERGRACVLAQFTWEIVGKQYRKLLRFSL